MHWSPVLLIRGTLLAGLFLLLAVPPVQAQRPAAVKLFPRQTVLYLQVTDTRELRDRFLETAMGQMGQDPQMQPLVQRLYAALVEASAPLEERLGVSLTDLLTIPQGELAVGLVAPEEGAPVLLALLDTGEPAAAVGTVLDRADSELIQAGAAREVETVGGTDLTIYTLAGRRGRQAVFFQKDGTLVIGSHPEQVKQLLDAWGGSDGDSLADNQQYAAISKSVSGAEGEEPQIRWYVDPIAAIRSVGRDNTGVQVASSFFPALGLDGLQGVGGGITLATEQFDVISRVHVLLESPRAGIVEMVAFGTGKVAPEPWVPANAATYTTLHWDAQTSYERLASVFDSFQGEGALKQRAQQRFFDRMGVDVEKDILPALDGRFTYVTMIEEPITPTSQAQLLGIRVKDPAGFEPILEKIADSYRDFLVRKTYASTGYYQYAPPQLGEEPDEDANRLRPCFGLVGDYLLVGRQSTIERAILAKTHPDKSLVDSLDFKLIASKAQRQPGASNPSLFSFNRPEEGLRFMYGLATAETTRAGLTRRAENNPFLRNVDQALDEHPLPPFATLTRYLAPGGAILVDDETGIHYTSFTLRRNAE